MSSPSPAVAPGPDPAAGLRRLLGLEPAGPTDGRSEPAAEPDPGPAAEPADAPSDTLRTDLRGGPEPGPALDPDVVPSDNAPAPVLTAAGAELLTAALARFDAPPDIRVRGGAGSGRRTLAAALRARRGWRVEVDDLDEIALRPAADRALPESPPDVEVICLRTAPCRHEEQWVRRPRHHRLLTVATGVGDDDHDDDNPHLPRWARGLPAVDARRADHRSVGVVLEFVDRALQELPALRLGRLEAELEQLAVDPETGELAELALCGLSTPPPDRTGADPVDAAPA